MFFILYWAFNIKVNLEMWMLLYSKYEVIYEVIFLIGKIFLGDFLYVKLIKFARRYIRIRVSCYIY